MISDMERTIIDCLRHPAFAGGITEVAKGMWMKRDGLMIVERLMEYAQRLVGGADDGERLGLSERGPRGHLDDEGKAVGERGV